MPELKDLYTAKKDQRLQEFITFLSFPSISSEEEFLPNMTTCLNWLKAYVEDIGFTTEVWETGGHPTLFAKNLNAGPDKPTLLIYNHYDVQPVDPIELWESPPFEPTIKNGKIYARGAQDNKGQCFYVLQALKLLKEKNGSYPINIKLCIEGEEETGSAGLSKILPNHKEALQADSLAIVDLGIPSPTTPAVTLGCRGMLTMDVTMRGSSTDLHSGTHGGIVYNPIHALVEVLAKLRDPKGKIAVPGFYDTVKPLNPDDLSKLALDFDDENYQETFGAKATGGEQKLSPLERAWTRPSLEINGINGGYTGTGFKTVIPAVATAKISCRLVPDQDPHKLGKLVANFIKDQTPKGIETTVSLRPGVGGAVRADISSPIVQAFAKAYSEVFDRPTQFIFEGASIPIVNELSIASGADVALVGLGLMSDKIHAPNEHFDIDRLEKGALIIARTIEVLGEE